VCSDILWHLGSDGRLYASFKNPPINSISQPSRRKKRAERRRANKLLKVNVSTFESYNGVMGCGYGADAEEHKAEAGHGHNVEYGYGYGYDENTICSYQTIPVLTFPISFLKNLTSMTEKKDDRINWSNNPH